jgi:biotin synthase-related radical SAM superfamily protein
MSATSNFLVFNIMDGKWYTAGEQHSKRNQQQGENELLSLHTWDVSDMAKEMNKKNTRNTGQRICIHQLAFLLYHKRGWKVVRYRDIKDGAKETKGKKITTRGDRA